MSRALQSICGASLEAVALRGSFTVALSGGSTPKSLYQMLADPNEPFRDVSSLDQHSLLLV